ncbi:LDL-receptor class A domain-containing protein 2 Skeletal organic matrix MAM and [Takifugu flavidus]|uniref:LDL-receptor class A domain-containing protein 2 Skeletal organic matrix MAM and n=1 Tax=Takifugu flavidus TaxID=433684 RepID=A0A5C6P3E6_9TELE|nr:LDL-receptor class A domain-containing protein 2 Skeletal organic matrix MAM and [Takifugu flavidus]
MVGGNQGRIAITDIMVYPSESGSCPPERECTFQGSLCGLLPQPAANFSWMRIRGSSQPANSSGPATDHTLGTEQGVCDFEMDFCGWVNSYPVKPQSRVDWDWLSGESEGHHVPSRDHTTNTALGHFAFFNPISHPKSDKEQVARLESETMDAVERACLELILQANCSCSDMSIALDDIYIMRNESCNEITPTTTPNPPTTTSSPPSAMDCTFEHDMCGFDYDLCGFHNSVTHKGQWIRKRATEEEVDHTRGTDNGFYVTVKNSTEKTIAQLLSPPLTPTTEMCVRFWYWLPAGSTDSLTMHVLRSGQLSIVLWKQSGVVSSSWEVAEVTVSSPVEFKVVLQTIHSPDSNATMKVDDVSLRDGACHPPGSCDFESGQCNWINVHREDGHDWVLANGGFRGPEADHTTQTPEEWIHLRETVCFSLWYHMNSSDSGMLRVYLRSGPSESQLMFHSNSSESNWIRFSQSVTTTRPFQVLIEAETNNKGFIAVDDITVTLGICPANETSSEFVGCSFENGTCGWEDSSVGQSQWVRGRNTSESFGPAKDHTVGTELGWYMALKPKTGENVSPAALQSPTMTQASTTCTLHFYYSIYVEDEAQLDVVMREGSQVTTLWRQTVGHEDVWRPGIVIVGRMPQDFSITFEGSRTFNKHGHVAIDDISFTNCTLPEPQPACPDNMFKCINSVCVESNQLCDYSDDCGDRSDEINCDNSKGVRIQNLAHIQPKHNLKCTLYHNGPHPSMSGSCTFERDDCGWNDTSVGQMKWQRQKASNDTIPPSDHTTNAGYYMSMNFSQGSAQSEARLQSPPLPPSSPYCQILDSTLSNWTPENLPIGLHQQPYRIWFSGVSKAEVTSGTRIIAVDDISFLNCEKSSKVPALQTYDCSFEDGLCGWTQGAEDGLDWTSGSGPTETPNTGPAGDHTTGKGKYLYINSSSARVTGDVAHLKTPLLPSGGRDGYCFTFWHHMFGATVGSLRVLLQTTDPRNKTMVWQKSGNQGDEWQLVQIHMTVQSVHQVILEATVGGKAGDIAVDDISLTNGPCSASDLCDFEEDSCGWQQQTDDDFDWVRQSGPSHNPNTGPNSDHTTNAPAGHYYYLSSSNADRASQTARMSSPLYPAGKGSCVQLWYFMYGRGVGTLNIYQQAADETPALLFSQMGDQGRLWRFAQASPLYRDRPYRIMVEGVKAGPSQVGDMAFDDVTLTDAQCPSPGHCDFEINMCSWSNVGGVDEEDWLRGRGDQPNLNTGPSIDHTTNSSQGYYLYVDSSVGEWGDRTFLVSDVFHPSTRGHCLTFWYHMSGNHVGTLRVFLNDRKMHATGNEEGTLKWMESGNKGDKWQEASVHIKHDEAFWFVFVYQRGMTPWGAIALDDISVLPGGCYSQPPVGPPDENAEVNVGLAVGLTVLAGLILCIVLFMLNRKRKAM